MTEPRLYPGTSNDERTSFAPYSAFDIPADLRELHGRYDVEATARRVRNFRYAEEWMMMIMGGWVATIPELPVKTGLGKVIWESARAADEFGKRLPERPPPVRGRQRGIRGADPGDRGAGAARPDDREAGRHLRPAQAASHRALRDPHARDRRDLGRAHDRDPRRDRAQDAASHRMGSRRARPALQHRRGTRAAPRPRRGAAPTAPRMWRRHGRARARGVPRRLRGAPRVQAGPARP